LFVSHPAEPAPSGIGRQDDFGRQQDDFACVALPASDILARPTHIKPKIAILGPAEVGETLPKYLQARLRLGIGLVKGAQLRRHAGRGHPVALAPQSATPPLRSEAPR
jgi:hypothetical protein